MVIPWKESWHKKMWPTLKSAIDFSRSPLLCVVKMELPKKYRNYQTNEFIWQLHIGDFFFHVKIQIIDDFNDEFLICKWQVYKIFFLTSWTWTKNGVLNFKCTRFNLHKHFSNVSQFPFWTPHQISFTMIKLLHV